MAAALIPHPDNPELFPITRLIITSAVPLYPDKVTFKASGISLRAIIQPSSRHKGLGEALDKNIPMSVKFFQVTSNFKILSSYENQNSYS